MGAIRMEVVPRGTTLRGGEGEVGAIRMETTRIVCRELREKSLCAGGRGHPAPSSALPPLIRLTPPADPLQPPHSTAAPSRLNAPSTRPLQPHPHSSHHSLAHGGALDCGVGVGGAAGAWDSECGCGAGGASGTLSAVITAFGVGIGACGGGGQGREGERGTERQPRFLPYESESGWTTLDCWVCTHVPRPHRRACTPTPPLPHPVRRACTLVPQRWVGSIPPDTSRRLCRW